MEQFDLTTALRKHFGFSSFRVGQREAIEHVLARRDALVVMPTGSGKSLCYQLPALVLGGVTLVISPLIALMKDQVDALTASKKSATFINSTLALAEQRERLTRLARGEYKIVYVAPERLRNADFLGALTQTRVGLLAVDEAHCISQWGHDFRPDYQHIREFITNISKPPVLALTATATPQVQDDILKQLGLAHADAARIVTGFNRPNIRFTVRYTPSEADKLRELQSQVTAGENGIIYTGTRREAEEIAEFVTEVAKIRAAHYHAGLDAETRTRTQDEFMHGALPVIVATNAFGMGVDKPDIRFVIHYSLPSTVEAYYQEVGRAGRDEKPARGVLLYSPNDRALQEWFIENDAPTREQTVALYRALPSGASRISPLDLQRETGMNDTKLRVALRQLESAGAIERLGDDHGAMLVQVAALARLDLAASEKEIKRFRDSKREKLAQIINYGETNACRRRFILDYFGDPSSADAPDCCDNHIAATIHGERHAESESEQIPLIILETVQTLPHKVGRDKLAMIVKGSRAQVILQFDFDRHKFYGKLSNFTLATLGKLIEQLIQLGYLKTIGGEYPVVTLSPLGTDAIKHRAAINLPVPQTRKNAKNELRTMKLGTVEYTHQLFAQNLSPAQIAKERGLTVGTIYWHAAQLIEQGLLSVDAVIPKEIQAQIQAAMAKAQPGSLTAIKILLSDTISFDELRCVSAARNLERDGPRALKATVEEELAPLSPNNQNIFDGLRAWRTDIARAQQLPPYVIFKDRTLNALARQRPQTLDELGTVFGIGAGKAKQYGEPILNILRQHPRDDATEDAIANFLTTARPKPLRGPWRVGFALDFHSKFSGARWDRTELGELVYRFKYAGEPAIAETIAARLAEFIRSHDEWRVNLIVPVPSTKKDRAYDPVPLLARALGKQISIAVNESALVKARATGMQKEMTNLAQKQSNVHGAFQVTDANVVRGKRILLLDDFYDSGATLAEATRVLLAAGVTDVCVLTVTKTIHAD